jgi:hypothetical protein
VVWKSVLGQHRVLILEESRGVDQVGHLGAEELSGMGQAQFVGKILVQANRGFELAPVEHRGLRVEEVGCLGVVAPSAMALIEAASIVELPVLVHSGSLEVPQLEEDCREKDPWEW